MQPIATAATDGYDLVKAHDDETIQCFLVSAKTPQRAILEKYGYHKTDVRGVYRSTNPICETIRLIVLNQLRPTPNNAPLKFFASRQKQQEEALDMLANLSWVNEALYWRLLAIHHKRITGEDMINLNTAELEHMGRVLGTGFLKRFSPADRLSGLSTEEMVPYLKVEEVVPYLKAEEVVPHLKVEDRLSGLSAGEVVRYFKPEDIWAGLSSEERQKLMELGRAN